MVKPRDYCCCAIPTVNAGIYLTLLEQLVAAFLVGILSMAAPHVVGASIPSMALTMIFGIICVALGALQILGFIGVGAERPILFRRFLSLHALLTAVAFSLGAVSIILSATRHSNAKSKCTSDFFVPDLNAPNVDNTLKDEANVLCEIFPWIDVGLMGAIWVLLGIVHLYLYTVMSGYSTGQQFDHDKYDALTSGSATKL
ncbi:hypothetical protein D9758_012740 [Tetrapyrgos nigripes]|uniref:Transmembrane protein n=1 Tax=Tetrapyrgos nigripes TaxID=182062 RepID=A0A8H5FRT6_9AGAR|nr:hypothetical protein D9758_012740 [Tetrapyrgos nigripes]